MKKLILTVACMAVVQGLWADVEAGKAYRLVPATDNGKAVFVENSAFDNGKKVMLWTHTPAPAQQWYAERQGEKWVLRNVYTGKYLTIASTVASSRIRPRPHLRNGPLNPSMPTQTPIA